MCKHMSSSFKADRVFHCVVGPGSRVQLRPPTENSEMGCNTKEIERASNLASLQGFLQLFFQASKLIN